MQSVRLQEKRFVLWDVILVAGGLLLVGITFRTYRFFEPTEGPSRHVSYSPVEADRRIESAKSYLASHPDSYSALTDLAIAYFQKGPDSYIDAMNALEKARAAGATDDSLFYYAGVMYDALGLPDYAANELSKYLRHHPDDYESLVRLANVYFREKDFDQAQTLYRHAVQEWPKDPTLWFNLAVVNTQKNSLDEAASDLQQVIKLAGQLPEGGYYQQGEIARLKGLEDNAIQSYQQELSLRPDYIPALEALEGIFKHRGDLKQVRAFQKRITDLNRAKVPPAAVAPNAHG